MTDTDKYAVFGNPIKHSKSPLIHAAFAQQCDQSLQYRAVRVELGAFARCAGNFFAQGGCGLNITVPFKTEAYEFADDLSDRARRAAAVNTLWRREDGTIVGDNTDGIGLIRDMVANLGWSVQSMNVLIVGAGGAVRGILEPLLRERPRELLIVNRTAGKAEQLAMEFADLGDIRGGGLALIEGRQFDLIINASSAGLEGQTADLPASVLSERSCCYDLLYGAEPTAFMRWAAQHTAWAVADGLGMLVEQAAESFYVWRKIRPETRPVINHVREVISET
jgi:shikimate dehydrogenase